MTMKRVINEKGAFDIRPAGRADLDYILASWQRTWEKSPEMNLPGMLRDQYFRHAHLLLDEILPRCSKAGSLYVCHQKGAPGLIRGYLCGEVKTFTDDAGNEGSVAYLHWVQVKKKEWNQGVASALMETFKADFGITPDQNILYTFSSGAMRDRRLAKLACERYNLVAWPWMKYTDQPEGWYL